MSPPPPKPSTLRAAAFLLLALGLAEASRLYVTCGIYGNPISFGDALGTGLVDALLWAPFVPLAIFCARRAPSTKLAWIRESPIQLGAALFAAAAQCVLFAAWTTIVRSWRFGPSDFFENLRSALGFKLQANFLLYGLCVCALFALHALRRAQREELERARLHRLLTETRLDALQSRLQPHFLFNALNTISALLRRDPDTAELVLLRLAELLRATLRLGERHEIALGEELELVEAYLAIQRVRFGERLRVRLEVEPAARACAVPPLFLQPLLENAIHHGLEARAAGGSIELVAAVRDAKLCVVLRDDGVGLAAEPRGGGFGIGIANTRARLQALHGESALLELHTPRDGGVEVRIELPARTSEAAA